MALILNPVSRGAARARMAVQQACADAGLEPPLVLETTIEEPGPTQARYAVDHRCARVVVAGGDGTTRLVAGALVGADDPRVDRDAAADAAARPVLGIVPTGTANLFARSARLGTGDLRAAARTAVTGRATPMDVGQVELETSTGETRRETFLVVTGLGHDAATLASVTSRAKSRLRWLAYFVPGLRRLWRPGHLLTITKDGQHLDVGPLWSVLAVNAARLPAGAEVVPGARIDDGILHLALVSPRGLIGWLRVAGTGLRVGRRASSRSRSRSYPRDSRALAYRDAQTVVVETQQPVSAQVDGDVITDVVRARINLLPGALDVAV
ncbi:diacylglycerol/lipid kinase family protein [Ornithinimicrobium panacihumi]|uniref:diacylglycerol/lipid kinase family protein n=1 Tax=Ornithinimicrobium panacihumi TaxID=2008449 RepID=UPI003F8A6B85